MLKNVCYDVKIEQDLFGYSYLFVNSELRVLKHSFIVANKFLKLITSVKPGSHWTITNDN